MKKELFVFAILAIKEHLDYEIREVNRQLESLNSRKRLLETYCS